MMAKKISKDMTFGELMELDSEAGVKLAERGLFCGGCPMAQFESIEDGDDYNKNVMAHFRNPRNMGGMKNPDSEATVGNPTCGDVMRIMIKIKDNKIFDIKFQTMGCVAAIASSSMLTVLAKGKSLDEAKKISNKDVARALGELPPIKVHCSNLAADALRLAIENYRDTGK
jgi:nitrogen fixation NifU-like protein